MAKVKIEEVVDHLSHEFRRALRATLEEHFPNQVFNEYEVYRTFKKEVYRKCSTWENIPDRYIEKD